MGNTHISAIKSPLECVNSMQVKREDEHTAEDIVGSDSVIANNHFGGIENNDKTKDDDDDDDDDDDAASVHEDQEEKILPMPADLLDDGRT